MYSNLENYKRVMDITHYYIEKGHGETIIMLHGNGGKSRYFKHQIDVFAQKYHVYAIDTRGQGNTPRGVKPFTILQFVEDLLDFMNEHNIEKANILGFSDGGNVAMTFAIKYPERVNRLILNGANLNPRGVKYSEQIPIEIKYVFAKILSWCSSNQKKKAELLGLMVKEPNISADDLKAIQAKTLVIVGTNDIIREKHSGFIVANLNHSEFEIIEGDHFVALRNPEEFNKRVMTFLSE